MVHIFWLMEGVLSMMELDDVFDQLIKASRSREHSQSRLDHRFELQMKISHTHIKEVSKDLTKDGEFGGKHSYWASLFYACEFIFELCSTLLVLIEGNESLEKGIIVSRQGRIGFKEGLMPFGGDAIERWDNEGNVRFIVMFLEGNWFHANVQLTLMEEGGKFICFSIECTISHKKFPDKFNASRNTPCARRVCTMTVNGNELQRQ